MESCSGAFLNKRLTAIFPCLFHDKEFLVDQISDIPFHIRVSDFSTGHLIASLCRQFHEAGPIHFLISNGTQLHEMPYVIRKILINLLECRLCHERPFSSTAQYVSVSVRTLTIHNAARHKLVVSYETPISVHASRAVEILDEFPVPLANAAGQSVVVVLEAYFWGAISELSFVHTFSNWSNLPGSDSLRSRVSLRSLARSYSCHDAS